MSLRPLSQSGLRHIAKCVTQRPIGEDGAPAKRTKLDAFNDQATDRYLHPTKGWRRLGVKRSMAAMMTAEMQKGMRGISSVAMREALKGALA